MAVTDAGLVVRFLVNEAASGQTPTTLTDSGPNGQDLAITYDGSNLNFVTESTRKGLRSSALTGVQRAKAALAGTAVRTALNGGKQFTIEIVYDHTAGSGSGGRIFGLNAPNGANGSMILKSEGSSVYLAFNDTNSIYAGFTPAAGIHRYWVVIDTDQAVADNRVRVSTDGAALVQTANGLGLGATLSIPTVCDLIAFNRESSGSFSRSIQGAIFYAAIYNTAFDNARITAHDADLAAGDDAIGGGGPTPVGLSSDILAAATVSGGLTGGTVPSTIDVEVTGLDFTAAGICLVGKAVARLRHGCVFRRTSNKPRRPHIRRRRRDNDCAAQLRRHLRPNDWAA
jgi:hypothetical protein